ncbi:polysaccharide biosynthesis protein [Bacillus sp. V59.32b]|uniref:putative polysaccharide biosynthesis protein n=1 Tax=Bacillus sp. V59.32b TaxID=1758642 RepID=UPI000E3E07AF|nr:polysaccharide biosynthesis protein [Bacillus sp. V59.32b]RFU69724.1 polysaccharide biosynthesis protein [Bacillus sp. V59.32b]
MSSKVLRGAFILTLGSVLSKVLGLLYVIPFDALLGEEGAGLYSYSYIPYTIFISLATAGMPLAVSKTVSKYNAIEEYAVSQKLFKSSLKLMVVTGFLAFLLMYAMAPGLASLGSYGKFSEEDLTTVIRAVSFALIIVPAMSIIRGFFQGHQDMKPTAVSQVIEQLVRIIFLLSGAFVVLKILDGDIVTAVSVATFAATIGAIGGLAFLLLYWKKQKPYLNQLLAADKGTVDISLIEVYKEIFFSSIPFIFVAIAMPLFQFVDNLTFSRAMASIGMDRDATTQAFGILNFNTQKLVVIPMTLATAFSMALVPSVTSAFVSSDMNAFRHQLDQAFQILLFVTIPAVIGMAILADPIYTAFYGHNQLGANILATYAPTAILFALFSVSAAVLQGINQQKFTVLGLLVGLLIKLSLNIPLIKLFDTAGAVYATTLGYLAACLLNLYFIRFFTEYSYKLIVKRTMLIFILSGIMALVVWVMESIMFLILDSEGRWQAVLITALCMLFGGLVYAVLSLKSTLAHRLFGNRIEKLQRKLKLKV